MTQPSQPTVLLSEAEQRTPRELAQQLRDHFQLTGTVRPEDVHRLLGDPMAKVEVKFGTASSNNLSAFLPT